MLARLIMASQFQSGVRWAFNCGSWSPSERDWQLLSSGLDAEDKELVGKYVFQKDAKSAMAGRYLIKKFVCEATGLLWKDIKILRSSVNKPYFSQESYSGPKVQFNISHSGDFVILAGEVGDLDLGVDVMKIEVQRSTSVSEFFRLMSRQFSPAEWTVVNSQRCEADQMGMFYRIWCLKESYTKATGTGLTVDLQQISFNLIDLNLKENNIVNNSEVVVEGRKLDGWKFEETLIDSHHIGTVALHCSQSLKFPPERNFFRILSYPELISHHQQISETDVDYCRKFIAKRVIS